MAEPLLVARNLRMSFGNRLVLDDVSFELPAGETLGIMGRSGGGKSTILRLIIGLARPERGSIVYRGRDLTRLSERELNAIRPEIGFVFQSGALFDSMTIEENLRYPLIRHTELTDEEIGRRVEARIRSMGLEGANQLYPSELSGGMLKRAGLLRATMLEPRLVLLDEPTAGLDPIQVRNFVTAARRIRKERAPATIFVSHDAKVIEAVCDRVAILWDGRIRLDCPAREILRTTDPVARSFLDVRLEGVSDENAS